MADYIDRDVAVAELKRSHEWHAETSRERSLLARDVRLLREMPVADVEPVIRCRDCAHWGPEGKSSESRVCWEMSDAVLEDYYYTPSHGYCHMAERRKDDDLHAKD